MTPLSLIREKPVNPYSGTSAGHTPEGVGFTAAAASPRRILTRAELAQCTCPEHCERDHEND